MRLDGLKLGRSLLRVFFFGPFRFDLSQEFFNLGFLSGQVLEESRLFTAEPAFGFGAFTRRRLAIGGTVVFFSVAVLQVHPTTKVVGIAKGVQGNGSQDRLAMRSLVAVDTQRVKFVEHNGRHNLNEGRRG